MTIQYNEAPDIAQLIQSITSGLDFKHINPEYIHCFRSRGSRSRRTIARIHSLEKLWQLALHMNARYLIEVIEERYDRLSQAEREKVLIHELLHIPKGFSGGFRPHKTYVSQKRVQSLHEKYQRKQLTTSRTSLTASE